MSPEAWSERRQAPDGAVRRCPALLCVRYRYDETRKLRLKTVEIVVEERPWEPPFRFCDDDIAPVAVRSDETALREKLRKLRAKWDPEAKVWMVRYGKIRGTELEARS